MKTEASVEIDRPIEQVFEYTNGHVAEWSKVVVEDEMLDEKPEGVGSTFRCVTEDRGQRMEFQGLVTRYESPTASAVRLTGKQFDIEAEYFFEDLSGRTRVTQRSTVNGKGFVKLMFVLFGWAMSKSSCRALQEELDSLKSKLEAQEIQSTS